MATYSEVLEKASHATQISSHDYTLNPPFATRRSSVVGKRGMVACNQPLAAEIGIRILRDGGNAADAAVAVAAAMNVAEPCSTGLGGDAFCLFYEAATKKVHCAMGNGRSPRAMSLEVVKQTEIELRAKNEHLLPYHAIFATVPGAAACWDEVVSRWGTLPLAQVLEPAAVLADEGFPVQPLTSYWWRTAAKQLQRAASKGAKALLTEQGEGPQAGQLMHNKDLANTLRRLGKHGAAEGFYRGPTADAIVAALQAAGSVMCAEDLRSHKTAIVDPISTTYRGLRVYETPPPTQGIAALIGLNLLQAAQPERPAAEWQSSERLHVMIEAMRLAFADAFLYNADPEHEAVPVNGLLDQQQAAQRWRQQFQPNKACEAVPSDVAGLSSPSPPPSELPQDTVYFCVVDGDGNACSFINSNYMFFGTGIVPEGCGFSLQNRGYNFSLDAHHANCMKGGKRPYHTIIPAMATDATSGELYAAFGVMGGFMQPQGHVQVLSNLVDYGHDPQTALNAPRFLISDIDSNAGPSCVKTSKVKLEEGFDDKVVEDLRAKGHHVTVVHGVTERELFGKGQIIKRDPKTGLLWGGADPRGDGQVIGF